MSISDSNMPDLLRPLVPIFRQQLLRSKVQYTSDYLDKMLNLAGALVDVGPYSYKHIRQAVQGAISWEEGDSRLNGNFELHRDGDAGFSNLHALRNVLPYISDAGLGSEAFREIGYLVDQRTYTDGLEGLGTELFLTI